MGARSNQPKTLADALALLRSESAPARLQRHAELVAVVAVELADIVAQLGVAIDRNTVAVGAALHDFGKISVPSELTGPGHMHEEAGEQALLAIGISPDLARFCRTHGLDASEMPGLEDLVVAIADKLWRGARKEDTESVLIDLVVKRLGADRWSVFTALDDCFERLARGSDARLARQAEA